MENFESNLALIEKSLKNIRGIFDKEKIEDKITELEKNIFKRKFLAR